MQKKGLLLYRAILFVVERIVKIALQRMLVSLVDPRVHYY